MIRSGLGGESVVRAAAGLDLCEGGEGTVFETLAPAEGLLREMARAWFDSMFQSFLLYLRKDPFFFPLFVYAALSYYALFVYAALSY
jgi:hypothetical protein